MALNINTMPQGNFVTIKHQALCMEMRPAPERDEDKEAAIKAGYREMTVQNPSDNKPDGSFGTVQKWNKLFGSIDNSLITEVAWYDRTNKDVRYVGVKLKFKDVDTNEVVVLDLPFATKGYDVFTRIMEDIDYTKPVEIRVWPDKNAKQKNAAAIVWYQNGSTIKWRYTKEYCANVVRELGAKKETEDLAYELHEALEHSSVGPELIEKVGKAGFLMAPSPVHNPLGKPQWNFDMQRAFLFQRLNEIVIPLVEELNPKAVFDEVTPDYVDAFEPSQPEVEVPQAPAVPQFTGPPPAPKAAGAAGSGWVPPGTKDDRPF